MRRHAREFLFAAAFGACTVAGSLPTLAQSAFLSPGICPQNYDPVCARKKKAILTYANACLAANDRAVVLRRDVCPQACPMIYKPVCALDTDGVARTYGNECAATASGAKIIKQRRC